MVRRRQHRLKRSAPCKYIIVLQFILFIYLNARVWSQALGTEPTQLLRSVHKSTYDDMGVPYAP